MQKLSTPTNLKIRITETRRLSRVNARVSTGDQGPRAARWRVDRRRLLPGCSSTPPSAPRMPGSPAAHEVLDQLRPDDTW